MGLWKNLMTKNWYKRKESIKPLPKIDLEWGPDFIIKDEVNDHVLLALSKENHDKLHRHRNDAVDALCCAANTLWKIDYTDNKDEWIKANPNAFKTKKWEEFKEEVMGKTYTNVGYEKNVIVPVDKKTNLASIDVDVLSELYKERDLEKCNHIYYRDLSCKLDAKITENKESDKNVKYWSTLCAEKDTQISDLKDKIKELESKKQNDIAVAKAEMQDKIDSLKVNLDYHVKQENYFREQYHKYKDKIKELEDDLSTSKQLCHNAYEKYKLKLLDINKLTNLLDDYRKQVDDLTLEIDKLKKKTSVEEYMKLSDKCTCLITVNEKSAAKIKELEEELEKYKKQCNRLSNEKINAWSSTHDNLNNANEQIKKLEAECAKWKNNFYKVCEEYTVYQKETRDNQNYYKLWKDLADKYCKLEDQYKVAVALGDKLLKQVTDLEKEKELASDSCEPSGTGCCFKE